ncbi:MAG: NAD-dependent epimerase/dehydratase family protein [Acidimicrobiia bacterium]
MNKCLVLGANGFLGSQIVDYLASQNNTVRAFDKYIDSNTRFTKSKNVELLHGEFLNEADISDALEDIDFVFHFISTTTPISSEDNPLIDVDTNIRYSVELFQRCVEKKIKKVIYASSGGSIYGNVNNSLISEDTATNPISPYAIGKLTIEKFLGYFREKHELESVVYRISNPYGKGQSINAKQGVIPIFLHHVINDEPITVFGDGKMIRDYIYVSDVAKMICETYENATSNIYNIGSGKGISINELIEVIESVTGKEVKVLHKQAPSTFVEKNVLDIYRFIEEFGIKPIVDIESGIKKTWDHFIQAEADTYVP